MNVSAPTPATSGGYVSVDRALVRARFLVVLPGPVIALVVCAALAVWWTPWWWLGVAAAAGVIGWLIWLVPRQVGALGYQVQGEDFLVTRGIMFRSLTAVPMGRLQYIEVERGPIDSLFGLAEVSVHTASVGSVARIPGLRYEDALALREALSARGRANLMGL